MSPGKPAGSVRVRVPRHHAERIGARLSAEVRSLSSKEGVRADTYRPKTEGLAQAIESASEWNSLLMTARAERGPQWDIGTQQFVVDTGSYLYYDPRVLFEVQKKAEEEKGREMVEMVYHHHHHHHQQTQPPI